MNLLLFLSDFKSLSFISPTHVCDTMGISESTYKCAIKELTDKRFLEKSENNLKYVFNEFPV